MSLPLPTVYSSATVTAALHENWLFQLHYDSSNFVGVSFCSTTVGGVYYEGAVENKPSIRESIDLANSTSKTGNITITLSNFKYNGNDFSQELFGGTNKYINKNLKIYSQLNDDSTLANTLQIFAGRITSVSHNANKITINATTQRPWDKISAPQNKSSDKNIYFPIAYGDFVGAVASVDYHSNKSLFPIPVNEIRNDRIYSLSLYDQTTSGATSTSPNPHWYDNGIDRFIPLYEGSADTGDNETESYKGGNGLRSYYKLLRKLKYKPVSTVSSGSWSNVANSYDTPLADDTNTTEALKTYTQSLEPTPIIATSTSFTVGVPQVDGKISTLNIKIAYKLDGSLTVWSGTPTFNYKIINETFGLTETLASGNKSSTGTWDTGYTTATSADLYTNFESNGGMETIKLTAEISATGAGEVDYTANFRIVDVRIETTMQLDFTEDNNRSNLQSSLDKINRLKFLYSGGDGYSKGYTGGSGTATEIHEAHRDILNRFAGWDDSDANIDGWSSLDTDRSGWDIRYWEVEPKTLKRILEKLQYEGCFIFKYRPDGTGQYIHIEDSPSVDFTLAKNDLENIDISLTPFSELLTKMEISYEKHPKKGYVSTATSTNSTSRTNWNIGTNENIEQINLDALVANISGGTNPNDDFATYYDNIFGDMKILVRGAIVNPQFYGMETGDILNFDNSDMIVAPFGDTWTSKNFIVTLLQRSPGKIIFNAREI